MPLESATHIADLNTANPVGSADKVQTLDDHVRLIKSVLKTDLNLAGAVTASHAELNILDGATLSTAELNILDGVTLTAAQINDAARQGVANVFTLSQTIANTVPTIILKETDAASGDQVTRLTINGAIFQFLMRNDADDTTLATPFLIRRSAGVCTEIELNTTAVDLNGNLDVSGTSQLTGATTITGALTAATIANSTSTTLVAGQLHFITGNATLPNLTAGQWIDVINDSGSPIDISKHASDTAYWTLTGASASTFTVPARGRLSAVCNPAGTAIYVSGNISAAS